MRRGLVLVFTFLAALFATIPAFAQSSDGGRWGVQGAVGIGYGTVPEGTTRDPETTFNGGVFAVLPMSDNWSFQPEVKFDKRTITIGEIPTSVSYLSVPVLLRNRFLGIYMVQGVAINTVMAASIFDVDFKQAITSPDVAIVIGIGKVFGRFSVDARWESGLRTFQKDLDLGGVRLRAATANVSIFLK